MYFILISLLFAGLIFFMILAIVMGAPLVPSKPAVATKMIELLQLKKGETFFDLGSGDGRLLILAGQRGARAYGVELNPFVWLLSYIKIVFSGQVRRTVVFLGNYWRTDLREADAIAIYALPTVMERLSQKIRLELKKGSRVVSNSFQIPQLKLVKKEMVGNNRIYLYKV